MGDISYYKLRNCRREEDGTLIIPVSVWGALSHSSCTIQVLPSDDAYGFWLWVTRPWRWLGFRTNISDEQLENLRRKYARRAT
jgi:hypothetical protein